MLSVRAFAAALLASLLTLGFPSPCLSGAVLKAKGADAMPIYTRSITARAEITGQFASTTLEIVYANESRDQIEADFIYALPPGAVATYFAYWAGDEKVEAKIVEKKEAARIYEHLTAYRRDPALVEFTGKNTFRARISPVFPDQDLKVELRYVQVIPSTGGSVGYTVSIMPACADQEDPLESIDVSVRVKDDGRVSSVANNHGIIPTGEPRYRTIAIKGANYRPTKDLTVRITRRRAPMRAELRTEPGGYFSLALTPDHSLKHPRVSISGVRVTQASPARLPDVRAGQSVAVSGRYTGSGRARVTLSGQSSAGAKSYSAPVEFGPTSAPGIATKLWAASRISDLGTRRSNRKAIVRLSFAYHLPSKYTSWLAVPKAEKQGLALEKVQPRLHALARMMADFVANGKADSSEYRALESEYNELCKPFGRDQTEWILLGGLSDRRYEAVRRLMEIRHSAKPDPAAEAEWLARAQRVATEHNRLAIESERTSLDDDIAREERYWLENACWDSARKLADMVIAGKADSAEAKALRTRYDEFRAKLSADSHRRGDQVPGFIGGLTNTLARQIVNEQHDPQPDKSKLAEMNAKIRRIAPFGDIDADKALADAEKSWASGRRWSEASAYAQAVEKGDTKEAAIRKQRCQSLAKIAGESDVDRHLRSLLEYRFESAVSDYLDARDNHAKPADVKRARARADRLAAAVGKSVNEEINERREWDAIHQTADRLYSAAGSLTEELDRKHPFRSRVERLRKDTGKIASQLEVATLGQSYKEAAKDYNAAADQAIAAWLDEQKVASEVRSGSASRESLGKASENRETAQEKLRAELQSIRSSIRGGDPLISVDAPENARSVVALLPDGDVKTLAWNPTSRRWEARFDVPTGTPDGDYTLTVIVVLADSTRRLTTVGYKVDNTPPSGAASAVPCGEGFAFLRLEVTPNEDLARVVALLPWGERVELKRTGADPAYRAIVPVASRRAGGALEFVLTDNAHNRGSVFAEALVR